MRKRTYKMGNLVYSIILGCLVFLATFTICVKDNEFSKMCSRVDALSTANIELENELKYYQNQYDIINNQYIYEVLSKTNKYLDYIEPLLAYDKQAYTISYLNIIENLEDPPETIYDYFTNEELSNLFNVVQVEVEEGGFIEKANVASVIYNRFYTNHMGATTMNDVLMKGGFSSIYSPKFQTMEISEETILACQYAFMLEDTTNGCIYFESCEDLVFESFADYMFTDKIGHKFYTERSSD